MYFPINEIKIEYRMVMHIISKKIPKHNIYCSKTLWSKQHFPFYVLCKDK